jgi:hypothetical protein
MDSGISDAIKLWPDPKIMDRPGETMPLLSPEMAALALISLAPQETLSPFLAIALS